MWINPATWQNQSQWNSCIFPNKSFASTATIPFHSRMYELSGTVKKIFDEQTFASGFNKREFVVTTANDKYPQDIKFECLKDNVELVNKLNEGEQVKVTFDISGREWNEKYFVNLKAFRIESTGAPAVDKGGSSDAPPPYDPADEILDQEPPF